MQELKDKGEMWSHLRVDSTKRGRVEDEIADYVISTRGQHAEKTLAPYRLLPFVLKKSSKRGQVLVGVRDFHAMDFGRYKDAMMKGKEISLTDADMEYMFDAMFHDTPVLFGKKVECQVTSMTELDIDYRGKVYVSSPHQYDPECRRDCALFQVSDDKGHTMFLPLSGKVDCKGCKRFKVTPVCTGHGAWLETKDLAKLQLVQASEESIQSIIGTRKWHFNSDIRDVETEKELRKSLMTVMPIAQMEDSRYGYRCYRCDGTPPFDVFGLLAQGKYEWEKLSREIYSRNNEYYHDQIFYRPFSFDPEDPRAEQARKGEIVTLTADDLKPCFDRWGNFLPSEEMRNSAPHGMKYSVPKGTQAFTLGRTIYKANEEPISSKVTLLLPKNIRIDAQSLLEAGYSIEAAKVDLEDINGKGMDVVDIASCGKNFPHMTNSIMPEIGKRWHGYIEGRAAESAALRRRASAIRRGLKERASEESKKDPKIIRRIMHRELAEARKRNPRGRGGRPS